MTDDSKSFDDRKSDTEKSAKWFVIVLGVILIVFIGGLFLNGYLKSPHEKYYNGFKVSPVQSGSIITYKTEVFINGNGPYILNTRSAPWDVEDIPIDYEVRNYLLSKDNITAVLDANDVRLLGGTSTAGVDLNNIVEGFFGIPVGGGSSTPSPSFNNIVTSCDDASNNRGIVVFEISDKNEIVLENSCVHVRALNDREMIRVGARLDYVLTGIMTVE